MKLLELTQILQKYPDTFPQFVLPDGEHIPAHAHVTEVGHLVNNFIDCGGVIGKKEAVLLQTHVGSDIDHRLKSDQFATILQLGNRVLPHDQLDVEVEYDCCVVAQYPIIEIRPVGEVLEVALGRRQTQCLAQERRKTKATPACCETESACC